MPLYEYRCLDHGHTFEIRHPITQDPVEKCPVCGGAVRRIIHPVGIVFKGSGFYATDSRGKGVSSSTRATDGSGPDSSAKPSETSTADGAGGSKKTDTAKPSTTPTKDSKASTS